MKTEGRLTAGAALFLLFIGIIADAAKFFLDFLFGIGLLLDPLFITPITTLIFWITLNHCGVSMFSGKNWAAAWVNEIFSLTPGIDAFPDWTTYTIYLIARNRVKDLTQGIMN